MKFFLTIVLCVSVLFATAQSSTQKNNIARPKLVVGIVIDQMRWDFLYRYYSRYGNDGFKRLLNKGFSAENCMIPYLPTYTAPGHASIFTGSVPAVHGITGNNFFDKNAGLLLNNVDDSTVKSVGTASPAGKMSPVNMLATTIGDEIRLASNFRSKVIGISLKDRGAIIPGGHTANAAYWLDGKKGNFITSTYYMNALPQWVQNFNSRKIPDSFYKSNWNTLYPISSYIQSTKDANNYEDKSHITSDTFPHILSGFAGKDSLSIVYTPFGINYTFMMGEAAIENENLGKGNETDMLCLSVSPTDYIGHDFGPNSIEIEDLYLRLDMQLASFFKYLDNNIGKNNYTLFLTADHGVANVPQFDTLNKLPGGSFFDNVMRDKLNAVIKEKFNIDKAVIRILNYQVFINEKNIKAANIDNTLVNEYVITYLNKQPEVSFAFELSKTNLTTMPQHIKDMVNNGYFPNRSGDIQIILKPGYFDAWGKGTSHGVWNAYDAHIPMLFYGWGIAPGKTNRETHMTDFAPTITSLLHIQMPSGSIGKVVTEALK